MSRSYRKTPAGGISGGSDKKDKRASNKKFRWSNKVILQREVSCENLKQIREVSDVYSWTKDGKCWYGNIIYSTKYNGHINEIINDMALSGKKLQDWEIEDIINGICWSDININITKRK